MTPAERRSPVGERHFSRISRLTDMQRIGYNVCIASNERMYKAMKASTGSMSNGLAAALVFAFVSSAGAATYVTNTVEGLIYLLNTYNTSDTVIELEVGDYHMPAVPAYTNSIGYSSIYVPIP